MDTTISQYLRAPLRVFSLYTDHTFRIWRTYGARRLSPQLRRCFAPNARVVTLTDDLHASRLEEESKNERYIKWINRHESWAYAPPWGAKFPIDLNTGVYIQPVV